MEQQPAKKRASRAKKPSPVPAAEAGPSVVSAFGGDVPAIFVEEVSAPVLPAPKAKKTSARKPPVVASVTPEGIQGSLSCSEQRPLIVHLPIKMSDIESDLFAPTPVADTVAIDGLVNPYDPEDSMAGYNCLHTLELPTPKAPTPEKVEVVASTVERPSLPLHYSEKLMVRFQDANRVQQLPESTNIACFWDCHPFNGAPCVIPIGIEEGIWRVYGNFSSPECAAAYLFSERLDSHVQWERYALLNRLYGASSEGIRLAPARSVLRMFGGPMDIADFRSAVADKRMRIDVMTPPMISIIQVMDTKPIDFYDAAMKNTFIPWEMDRMQRPGAQGLRLRRTKPVAEKEATLEYCMGIVV
jgi:hypothetical protein